METVIVNGIKVTFGGDRAQTVQRMVEFLDMAGATGAPAPETQIGITKQNQEKEQYHVHS